MSNEKILHIISHDVPWPPDYGGVVDLFYKLKSLHAEGVKIKLHCFDYGRGHQDELNKYCTEVNYYERRTGWEGISLYSPYIVYSRANPLLLQNLLKDDDPVLMEGIHCTAFARQLLGRNRRVFLRLHNVESLYYSQLAKTERNLFRKLFFMNESVFLEKYEKRLPQNLFIIAVSSNDAAYYREEFEKEMVEFLPLFIPYSDVGCPEGKGDYCLYHGNLSVAENEKAAVWLLEKVFSLINIPFVIAGKNPSGRLLKKVKKHKKSRIVINPTGRELDELINKAHIHVLPSFNTTGIKLKLINALYNGRHCVVNDAAVQGSDLEAACHLGANATAFASIISQLYQQPFAEEEIVLRKKILPAIFNNRENARRLMQWIW
jgi:glycosyltransferase involved in cell wall biosynthesis